MKEGIDLPPAKRRKLEENTTENAEKSDEMFIALYNQAKFLIDQHQTETEKESLRLSRSSSSLVSLDAFLKELGKTQYTKLIDRLFDEYGADYLEGYSGVIGEFLSRRAGEMHILSSLASFPNALRAGYRQFLYNPRSSYLGEVLNSISLCKSVISKLWRPLTYRNPNAVFNFLIPNPLSGTAEQGQFFCLQDLPSQFRFSSECLDLSHTHLSPPLLEEIMRLDLKVWERFKALKLNYTRLGDEEFQKLYPLILNEKISDLAFDDNQMTFKSLDLLLSLLIKTQKVSSNISFSRNKIKQFGNLIHIFKTTKAQGPLNLKCSSLLKLDLSGNPFTKQQVIDLLTAFIKNPQSLAANYEPHAYQSMDFYDAAPKPLLHYEEESPPISESSDTRLYFSETTIVLKGIASLKGNEQEIKDFLSGKEFLFKIILDKEFIPAKI